MILALKLQCMQPLQPLDIKLKCGFGMISMSRICQSRKMWHFWGRFKYFDNKYWSMLNTWLMVFSFHSLELCSFYYIHILETCITILRNPVQCVGVTRYLYLYLYVIEDHSHFRDLDNNFEKSRTMCWGHAIFVFVFVFVCYWRSFTF